MEYQSVFHLNTTLANVLLCYHEKIWLENCPSEFKSVIYRKYLNETFLLSALNIKWKSSKNLNRQHKTIRFTSETKSENSISVIGIKIGKDSDKFTA